MTERQKLTARELARLRKKYPLPEGVPDARMNLTQIAQFMGTTNLTISNWLTQGLPTIERGAKGREYRFRAADVWAWKRARDTDEDAQTKAAREAIQAMRLQLIGGSGGRSIDALSPKEKREVIQAQMAHEQFQKERNELLKRDDVRDAFEVVLSMMRDALDALPDRISREASLDNKQVGLAADVCDQTLSEMQARIERFFAERPVPNEDPRKLI